MWRDGSRAMTGLSSDIAFTPAVKAVQSRKGSRRLYAGRDGKGAWPTAISADLKAFIEAQTSVLLATASAEGQPYVQHRGGPAGFLRVIDETTIGFVDFAGNRQYISIGNLTENPKAFLFLIDYTRRRRVKFWGTAKIVEGDEDLVRQLMPNGYRARPEQVILFAVSAWDANCPQHIPQRFEAADIAAALAQRDRRIAELEEEVQALKKEAAVPAIGELL